MKVVKDQMVQEVKDELCELELVLVLEDLLLFLDHRTEGGIFLDIEVLLQV
jgi:hypothetical protein